jgi:hypothetical protein
MMIDLKIHLGIKMENKFMIAMGMLFLSGCCKGISDTLQFHYKKTFLYRSDKFNDKFWNPAKSHARKWKNGNPANGERYLFSSTLLVWTTDAWHLSEFFRIKFVFTAVAIPLGLYWQTVLPFLAFYAGFWAIYEIKLLHNKL